MNRFDIINAIASKTNPKDYLEIGVYDGYCFERVNIPNKDAVDPDPKTEHTNFRMTSDKFFEYLNPKKGYDVIFIDGLHLHHQSRKDFINAERHLNPGGFILFHDTNPPTKDHGSEEWILGDWNGTVYQTIMEIRSEWTNMSLFTVDTDWGVTVVQRGFQNRMMLNLDRCLNYDFFEANRKEVLNLISVDQFNEWVSKL